jgi:hypothetical protein
MLSTKQPQLARVMEQIPVSLLTILHLLPLVAFMVSQIMVIRDNEKMNVLLSKM